MKSRKLLLKAVSMGMALTLTCSIFPMQSLRAEELKKEEEKEDEDAKENLQEVIEILDADDFLEFADHCYIDAWSADKNVILGADIDLSNTDFQAIPVFAGVFDGQGHTISGFQYGGDGYVAGLFRYIEKDGVVKNLTLKGEVIATDEKECTGGLCGVNYGTIQKCSFQGTVSGRNIVGGLVGINEGTGGIWNCSAGGRVTGYYSTGGIVGINHGEITTCTNRVCVNNDTEWVEEDDEMGMGLFLSISLNDSETEFFSGVDTGGIAGHSDGMITGCINYGKIGYEHTGYNIGGIAGRQSGVVSSCRNYGTIYGRKDVGGIVGQMEPYIEVDEAASLIHAVNKLHDLMEKTLDDMQEGKNAVKGDLDSLVSYSEGAVDAGDALASQMADFVDDNMDQAQAVAERVEHIMDMLPDVFDDVYAAEDSFSSINTELYVIADSLKEAGKIDGAYVETDYNRLTLLSTVGGSLLSLQYYPAEGDTVHILAEPDKDYGLDYMKVVDADGNNISIQQEDDENYTFTMPEANVRVEAYFSYCGTDFYDTGDDFLDQDSGLEKKPGDEIDADKDEEKDGMDLEEGEDKDGETEDKNPEDGIIEDEKPEDGTTEDKNPEDDTIKNEDPEDGTTEDGKPENGAEEDDGTANEGNVTEDEDESKADTSDSSTNVPDLETARIEKREYRLKHLMSERPDTLEIVDTLEDSEESREERKTGKPIVKLSSNLSGNASCEIDGDKAILTVIPDGAYTVSGVSAATEDGQSVSVSKSGSAYIFSVNEGEIYQVYISFDKQDKSQVVSGAKGDISDALKRQQEAMDRVNAIMKEIQESSSASVEQLERLSEALAEMSNAASSVLSSLSAVSNVVGQQTLDQISNVGNSMEKVLMNLQSAVGSIKSATRDTRSIVDYVNGQSGIRFSKMGKEFDTNREKLHEQLKGMSGSLQSLSGNASDYSDVLNDDLRAVNDQINIIFNILADNLTSYSELSMEELYENVDVEDTASITTGKADNCTNEGIVKGDINIGGIAGAMSIDEEDPEDSAAGSVNYQIGRRYFTKCIITGCVNEGYVTAKKDGAGGIVGYMKHGIVVDSEGYGSVESIEGDYVGGICGESLTVIKRCYALCSVSGGKNVGGIAGYADTLKDCYAMTDCNALIGKKGAIAGQTANYEDTLSDGEAKVSGNCYVGDNLYGIDNISYVGVAEPISYEELLTVENLPMQFRHLKVIYRVDDLYLGIQEVKFGEKLSCLNYPEIPQKEGYYGVWPDYSDKIMMGNLLVTGEYKEDVTVVQSGEIKVQGAEGEIKKPYALVEQNFTENTILNAVISDREPPEQVHNKENIIYDITLEHAEVGAGDTFAIRLYNPYEDAVVWGCIDGNWKELESKVRGQYLQVDMTGTEQSFCVVEHKSRIWILLVGIGGGIAAAILLTALIKKSKSKRRKEKISNA